MVKTDEDALICDFAEYYHLDYTMQGVTRQAILAVGLPPESRIKTAIRDKQKKLEQEKERLKRMSATETSHNERIFNSADDFKRTVQQIKGDS